jgi:predicted phosphodiesterase
MRYAIISDIHANGCALDAVRADADKCNIDSYWCLGDIVGYGPEPDRCIRFLHEQIDPQHWVLGNHDAALTGLIPVDEFNTEARDVIYKHRTLLQHADNQLLWHWCQEQMIDTRMLPKVEAHGDMLYVFVHACLVPNQYILCYLYPWRTTLIRWNGLEPLRRYLQDGMRACLLFGHTHIPTFCEMVDLPGNRAENRLRSIIYNQPVPLDGRLMALNPGSVGQPRDGDRRAAYAIIDTKQHTVEFRRVTYPFDLVQAHMQQEGYPASLREHLSKAGNPLDEDDLVQVYQRTVYGLEVIV